MIVTLKKHGNSHALIVNRTMMEAMGIQDDTPLQVTVSDGSLVVKPTNVGIGEDEIMRIIDKLRESYTPMLQRLAQQ